MLRYSHITALVARLAGVPFLFSRRTPFHAPHKALILQPCCLSQVMLTTPLLAALSSAFPQARFDWALTEWAVPAVASNKRVTEILPVGERDLQDSSWREIGQLILRLRQEHYDTVFIPSGSSLLSYIAWQAGINQRIGLDIQGRGFAHTIPVTPPAQVTNRSARALLLAEAVGVDPAICKSATMEYSPPDDKRTAITRRLVEEVDWLGDAPLVVIHPGGGVNPMQTSPMVRWPVERFVILANHLTRAYEASIVLVGMEQEKAAAKAIAGMMAGKAVNYCGQLGLGEVGALCEVADLYIGNDTGTSHVAAATGCRTLVIYGPTNPAYSSPYSTQDNVHILWRDPNVLPANRPFTWDNGVTAGQAITAVDQILQAPADRQQTMAIISRKRK